MAGPNSAPNGERGLVKGPFGDWKQVSYYDAELDLLIYKWVPMRDYLAARRRLVTGKTEGH